MALAVLASGCVTTTPSRSSLSCEAPEFAGLNAIEAETMDDPPQPLHLARPEYPVEDRRRSVSGEATVRVVVGADGTALCSDVLRATTRAMGRAAQESIHASTFTPGQIDGRPVPSVVRVPVTFRTSPGVQM